MIMNNFRCCSTFPRICGDPDNLQRYTISGNQGYQLKWMDVKKAKTTIVYTEIYH